MLQKTDILVNFVAVTKCVSATNFRYVGLSSTGVTYKSGSASYSGGSFQGGERYGVISGDRFKDSYREKDHDREEKIDKDSYGKSSKGFKSDDRANASKRNPARYGRFSANYDLSRC